MTAICKEVAKGTPQRVLPANPPAMGCGSAGLVNFLKMAEIRGFDWGFLFEANAKNNKITRSERKLRTGWV